MSYGLNREVSREKHRNEKLLVNGCEVDWYDYNQSEWLQNFIDAYDDVVGMELVNRAGESVEVTHVGLSRTLTRPVCGTLVFDDGTRCELGDIGQHVFLSEKHRRDCLRLDNPWYRAMEVPYYTEIDVPLLRIVEGTYAWEVHCETDDLGLTIRIGGFFSIEDAKTYCKKLLEFWNDARSNLSDSLYVIQGPDNMKCFVAVADEKEVYIFTGDHEVSKMVGKALKHKGTEVLKCGCWD